MWACLLGDSRLQQVHSLIFLLDFLSLKLLFHSPHHRLCLIMASTTSLLEPAFTKPMTSMTLVELWQTWQFFELPQTGIMPMIQNWLQNFLTAHKQEMQHNYNYIALYPNRDPSLNGNQPADDSQDLQAFSQWNGIGGGEPACPSFPQCVPSVVARANNQVKEYLQGKSSHACPLLPLCSSPVCLVPAIDPPLCS